MKKRYYLPFIGCGLAAKDGDLNLRQERRLMFYHVIINLIIISALLFFLGSCSKNDYYDDVEQYEIGCECEKISYEKKVYDQFTIVLTELSRELIECTDEVENVETDRGISFDVDGYYNFFKFYNIECEPTYTKL